MTILLKISEEGFGSGQISMQLKSQFSIALDNGKVRITTFTVNINLQGKFPDKELIPDKVSE